MISRRPGGGFAHAELPTPFSERLPASQSLAPCRQRGAVVTESVATVQRLRRSRRRVDEQPAVSAADVRASTTWHSPKQPENLFSDALLLYVYSRGMGRAGLPGDRLLRLALCARGSCRAPSPSPARAKPTAAGQFFRHPRRGRAAERCCEVCPRCWRPSTPPPTLTAASITTRPHTNRRISAVDAAARTLTPPRFHPLSMRGGHFYQNAPDRVLAPSARSSSFPGRFCQHF